MHRATALACQINQLRTHELVHPPFNAIVTPLGALPENFLLRQGGSCGCAINALARICVCESIKILILMAIYKLFHVKLGVNLLIIEVDQIR
jgi:hypothetical protein